MKKILILLENIEQIKYPLALEDKRIWVLRKDFNLILGIKNAYKKEHNYHGFEDNFNPKLFTFIDLKDRYGHPSLCLAEEGYDGSVFYAGYLCQRAKFLQVYLVSGRFDRKDLNKEQTSILEAYIALQLLTAFGIQNIVFDFGDPDDSNYHQAFFSNRAFPLGNPRRAYSVQRIHEILDASINNNNEEVAFHHM